MKLKPKVTTTKQLFKPRKTFCEVKNYFRQIQKAKKFQNYSFLSVVSCRLFKFIINIFVPQLSDILILGVLFHECFVIFEFCTILYNISFIHQQYPNFLLSLFPKDILTCLTLKNRYQYAKNNQNYLIFETENLLKLKFYLGAFMIIVTTGDRRLHFGTKYILYRIILGAGLAQLKITQKFLD